MPTTTTGLATSFINFSRPGASGGGATTTDRDGKIKWAGHNLLPASEQFDSSAWSKAGVSVTANTYAAPDGATTADTLVFSAGNNVIYRDNLTIPSAFVIGCWVRSTTGTATFRFTYYNGSTSLYSSDFTATTSWQFFSATFTGSGVVGNAGISTASGLGATTIVAWGAHLYRSDLGGMQLNPAQPAGMQSYYPTTPRNLLGYTEDFSNNAIWGAGAYGTANSVVGPNGLQTADTIAFTAALKPSISQTISSGIVGGSTYTISVWAKASSTGTPATSFRITTNNTAAWSTGVTQKFTLTSSWQRFSVTGVIASSGTAVRVLIGATNLDGSEDSTCLGSVDLYGIQLSDSASLDTYVPVYGAAVTSAAYYAPRLDFDPVTLAAKGLLVEELRTNVVPNSNVFNIAAWPKGAGGTAIAPVVTAADAVAPDGTLTAQKVVFDRGAGNTITDNSVLSTSISGFAAATSYTGSVYIKAATAGDVGKQIGWRHVAGGSYGIITLTASWQRVTRTETSSGTSSTVEFVSRGTVTADNTVGAHIWGVSVEVGASNAATTFPTSLIPTGSATATRAADVASVSTQAFPYSQSEGTIVANGTFFGLNKGASDGLVALSSDLGSQENIAIFRTGSGNNIQFSMRDNNSDQAVYTVAMGSQPVKAAFAYAANNSNAALNGVAQTTDVACSVPTMDKMLIGAVYYAGDYPTNGWIRQITYIPRRFTNAELQSRTA